MTTPLSWQGWLFLYTVLAGAGIGIFYDIFRILRKIVPHNTFAVQFEDAVFWITATATVFFFMLNANFGEIRPFAILGMACGAVLYFATLSHFVLKILVTCTKFAIKVTATAIKIITAPIRFIFNLIALWVFRPTKNFLVGRRKNLRTLHRYGKIKATKAVRNFYILRKKV